MNSRPLMRALCRGVCWIALPAAAYAADMDKLLTGNMESYRGKPALEYSSVDVVAEGRTPAEALNIVYDGASAVSWTAGEALEVVVDLRSTRVVKTVHVRFGGDISEVGLGCSLDRATWRPMETHVKTYPRNRTWYEAVDYAAPARYVRLSGTAGSGLAISETRIYGADMPDQVDLVDGVYACPAPAVAGTEGKLNIVIANTTAEPMNDLTVTVTQAAPGARAVGTAETGTLSACRSTMFAVPWTPVEPEPHRIALAVRWSDEDGTAREAEQSFTVPVVNRRLWFGSTFRWATFEGPTWFNFQTPYYEEDDPGQIRLLHRRGGLCLRGVSDVAHGNRSATPGQVAEGFIQAMDYSDGISINEYTDNDPEIIPVNSKGLKAAREARPEKVIAPWAGGPDHYLKLFRDTAVDVVLLESYMTIFGPKVYEHRYAGKIDSLRKQEISNRAILVQGIFGGEGKDMTLQDLENSVRFVRHYGPELPGMGFYGGWIRGATAGHYNLSDQLCYTYFIAPAITPLGEPQLHANSLEVTLRNVGGMNAHDVRVAAIEAEGNTEIARSDAISIPAGELRALAIPLPEGAAPTIPDIRILPSENYTVLQFKTAMELYAQHRAEAGGMGVQRVAYLGSDPDGLNPVPEDAWQSEDPTPEESRDDYESLNRHDPAGGAYHPSAVLDLGGLPERHVIRLRCRGYNHMADEARRAAFLQGLRVFLSSDNVTYVPVAAGFEAKWGETPLFLVLNGLRTRARYIKINCVYEYEGKGYWVPKAPDDLDAYYTAGDGGLIGWDVYFEPREK